MLYTVIRKKKLMSLGKQPRSGFSLKVAINSISVFSAVLMPEGLFFIYEHLSTLLNTLHPL